MDFTQFNSHGLLLLGGAVVVLAVLVWFDLPAFVLHLLVAVGAFWAFPGWGERVVAFVGGNVLGVVGGLAARHLTSGTRKPKPEDPAPGKSQPD